MDQILHQLGGLLLGAIPTIIFFLLTWFLYNSLVHKKLMAVLEERKSRTEGAMAKAKQDIAAAETKAAEYESRIREARQAVYKAAEERRRKVMEARAAALAQAKATATEQVKAARSQLDKETAE